MLKHYEDMDSLQRYYYDEFAAGIDKLLRGDIAFYELKGTPSACVLSEILRVYKDVEFVFLEDVGIVLMLKDEDEGEDDRETYLEIIEGLDSLVAGELDNYIPPCTVPLGTLNLIFDQFGGQVTIIWSELHQSFSFIRS